MLQHILPATQEIQQCCRTQGKSAARATTQFEVRLNFPALWAELPDPPTLPCSRSHEQLPTNGATAYPLPMEDYGKRKDRNFSE